MNITNKPQVTKDLDNLERRVQKATQALAFAASQLNLAYDSVWNLPDDRLQALLQYLVDQSKFEGIFSLHEKSASYINELLTDTGDVRVTAKVGAGREFEIDGNGSVSVIPLPQPEPIEEEQPEEIEAE